LAAKNYCRREVNEPIKSLRHKLQVWILECQREKKRVLWPNQPWDPVFGALRSKPGSPTPKLPIIQEEFLNAITSHGQTKAHDSGKGELITPC
jgi:hypothetical protein